MSTLEITLLSASSTFFIGLLLCLRKLETKNKLMANLKADYDQSLSKIGQLEIELEKTEEIQKVKVEGLERDLERTNTLHAQMKTEFEKISQQALLKSLTELKQNSNHEISQVISPFKENLNTLRAQIEKFYINEEKERFALKKEINQVVNMGNIMSQETANLTKALKGDSKKQGDWGEMILENLLEFSGLEKNIHYISQGEGLSLKDENGKRQKPDIIINLPENKSLIIDSKVSLTHYERFINEENEELQKSHLADYIQSIKNHIKDLSSKKYHLNEKLSSPEFVLMFLPIEQAFSLATGQDKKLLEGAFENSIILVSPSTLLASLKLIYSIWRQENSNKNSEKIAIEAGKIYDKMVLFQEEFHRLGESINKNKIIFDNCLNKFSTGKGNILTRFDNLKKLGAKSQKTLKIEVNNQFDRIN